MTDFRKPFLKSFTVKELMWFIDYYIEHKEMLHVPGHPWEVCDLVWPGSLASDTADNGQRMKSTMRKCLHLIRNRLKPLKNWTKHSRKSEAKRS